MRKATIERNTNETRIALTLNLDGTGESQIDTGCGFFDHMMTLFASHSGYDLTLRCEGDTYVDAHHTVEDVGICLGKAFLEALGEKRGIVRYGEKILPMDEALILAALDISGRGMLCEELEIPYVTLGTFDSELCAEFWHAFTREAGVTLHLRKLAGSNVHHIIEGVFKASARALSMATAIDEKRKDKIPSSKGVL